MNYRTGRIVALEAREQHEIVIRDKRVAHTLGVPTPVYDEFARYKPEADRCRFLKSLMAKVPLMRVRGHGSHVTFEYAARSKRMPEQAVRLWARKYAVGPATLICLVNLRTGRHRTLLALQFLAGGKEHER